MTGLGPSSRAKLADDLVRRLVVRYAPPVTVREGWLVLDGWAGLTAQRVEIVGETPRMVRIRAIVRTRLAGRSRWLEPGEVALVPWRAVLAERPAWAVDEA